MGVEIRKTDSGWTYCVNNIPHGGLYIQSKTFFKKEKPEGRFRKLKDGEGHGFPVMVLNRLANDECRTIVIRENKVRYAISFKDFTDHMGYRNLKNERKVFCSLKWFSREKIEQKAS